MEKNKEIIIYIILFFIMSTPLTYILSNKVLKTLDNKNCPTYLGIFLHTIIFGLIIYLINNIELIKENFVTLQQETPKICDINRNNCPSGYSCLPNYNFCKNSIDLPLCQSGHARCFKKCYKRNLKSGDHDCASEEYRSPGWDRYKKNKVLKWKK